MPRYDGCAYFAIFEDAYYTIASYCLYFDHILIIEGRSFRSYKISPPFVCQMPDNKLSKHSVSNLAELLASNSVIAVTSTSLLINPTSQSRIPSSQPSISNEPNKVHITIPSLVRIVSILLFRIDITYINQD